MTNRLSSACLWLFVTSTGLGCSDVAPLDPSDAGPNDASVLDAGLTDAGLEASTAFRARVTFRPARGAPTEATLVGRLDASGPILRVAFEDGGPATHATGRWDGDVAVFEGVEVQRDFFSRPNEGWSLRDRWTFERLSFTPNGAGYAITGTGESRVWLSTDVFDEQAFTADGATTSDATRPRAYALAYSERGPAVTPFSAAYLIFDKPVDEAALAATALAVADAPLSATVIADEASEGFAHRATVSLDGAWPLDAEVQVAFEAEDWAGQTPAPLTISGPTSPPQPLATSVFPATDDLGTWVGVTPPVIEQPGAPFAQTQGALHIDAPGAWARFTVGAGARTVRLRVTYLVRTTGVPPSDNPDWVREAFGWSATAGDEAGVVAEVDVNLLEDTSGQMVGSETWALAPREVTLDVSAAEGRELTLELSPRNFSRSPATGYGYLLVDSVHFE